MHIMITGGLGLIGHNVVRMLETDHRCTIIDNQTNYGAIDPAELWYLHGRRLEQIMSRDIRVCNVQDHDPVLTAMQQTRPEVIVHLASFPRQQLVQASPELAAQVMIQGLINVLEAAISVGTRRVVFVSSSMVYGDFSHGVVETAPCHPKGLYGILKLTGENIVRDYSARTGIEHVIVRPSAVYGPRDVSDRLVGKFLVSAMRGETLYVDGIDQTLDFTYVSDAAQGIVNAALRPGASNNTFNVTRGRARSIMEAAELAVSLAGQGTIVVRNPDQSYPTRGEMSIQAARELLNFCPQWDIESGFKNYYEWLKNSVFWSRPPVH